MPLVLQVNFISILIQVQRYYYHHQHTTTPSTPSTPSSISDNFQGCHNCGSIIQQGGTFNGINRLGKCIGTKSIDIQGTHNDIAAGAFKTAEIVGNAWLAGSGFDTGIGLLLELAECEGLELAFAFGVQDFPHAGNPHFGVLRFQHGVDLLEQVPVPILRDIPQLLVGHFGQRGQQVIKYLLQLLMAVDFLLQGPLIFFIQIPLLPAHHDTHNQLLLPITLAFICPTCAESISLVLKFGNKIQQIQKMSKIDITQTNQTKLPSLTYRNTVYNQTITHRLGTLKKSKVRAVNLHIKATVDNEQPQRGRQFSEKINNSLQIPLNMGGLDKPTNPHATVSNFLFDIFSPNKSPNNLHVRDRQKSTHSQKSSTTKNSKQVRKQRQTQMQNSSHMETIKKLQQCLNQDNLEKRLSMFSKESGKNSIRVYKEDIRKIIIQRYNKDRITTFLDTQYIQDFDSVYKTMKQLTSLKQEEMLVFSFLMIDQNKDGLITIEDLMNLLGIRSKTTDYNPLITSDILKIYGYVQKMKQRGDPVMDSCDRQILKDQSLTFMKYRINNFRQKKQQTSGQDKRYFLSCRLHPHLYTLRNQDQSLQAKFDERVNLANAILSLFGNKINKNQSMMGSEKKFSINFQRFAQIFNKELPKIFLDFLYLLGGMEVPGQQYLKVDNSILQEVKAQEKPQQEQQDKMVLTHRRIQKMSNFKKQLKIMKIRTEP